MTAATFSLKDRPYLLEQLRLGVVEVDFIKANGDKRTMRCTLKNELLPAPEKPLIDTTKPERKVSEHVIAVYDLDAKGWRSFRIDSLTSMLVRK